MSNKTYTQEELFSLLQSTADEANTILMDASPQSHQYFYQHFASLSLKAFKYVRLFLNLVSSNQRVGNTIDCIFKTLTQSMQQYRGRNIYAHSARPQDTDHHEQDEIYHFLNTRNSQIPADLLNNYQSQKQRLELQQFVEQFESQQRFTAKKVKRRPIPAQQSYSYSSNSGRKTTLFAELKNVQQPETNQIISVAISTTGETMENRHIQIQTEQYGPFEQYQKITKNFIDNSCQYECVPQQQIVSLTGVSRKKNSQNNKKAGDKKNVQRGDSKLRKATFNDEASIRSKQTSYHLLKAQSNNEKSLPNIGCKENIPQIQPNSLKSVKTNEESNMVICQRVLHIAIQGGVSCDLLTQNGLNKSMRTISRKKIVTGGQIRAIKSTTKIDDESLLKGSKDPNLSSWKPQLRKQSSIFDKVKANLEVQSEESELQLNKEQDSKQKRERTNKQKDNFVGHQQHSQNQKGKQRLYLQSVERGTRQRVSIVNVKIVDQHSHVPEDIVHSNHSQHFSNIKRKSMNDQNGTNSFKKKDVFKKNVPYSNFKEAERQRIGQGEDNVKQSQHLKYLEKTRPITVAIGLQSNATDRVEDQAQSAAPAQILNCQTWKQDNQQSKQMIKKRQGLTNSKNTSKHKEGANNLSHSLGSSADMMIIFSSKSKATQDQNIVATVNQNDEPSQNRLAQKRNIQTSQQKLSTIVNTGRLQESSSVLQSKFASLSKFRSKECKTVANASRSLSKLLNRQNSQGTPIKTSLHRLKKEIYQTRDSSNNFQNHSCSFASQHTSKSSFSQDQLKRKLRNRTNKDKLQQYLELVEATHKKFCGEDCEHIQRLLEGKEGSINEQLIRLFSKTN